MVFILGLLIIALILLTYGYIANYFFTTTEYVIDSDELFGILGNNKVVIISDLHNISFGTNNKKLIEKIDAITPQYVIIAGDMMNHISKDKGVIAQQLVKELSKKYVIIYADGNHEQGFFESNNSCSYDKEAFDRFYSLDGVLPNKNIYHLTNEYIELDSNSGINNISNINCCKKIRIYGLQIERKYYRRYNRPQMNQNYLQKLIGKAEKNCYNIVIAHNPLYFDDYVQWGADLVIAGHLHGGFIRIPGIGGVISPQMIIFPKYSGGLYKYGKGIMILSRGLGMHTLKIRIFNSPELVTVSINNSKNRQGK